MNATGSTVAMAQTCIITHRLIGNVVINMKLRERRTAKVSLTLEHFLRKYRAC